MIKKTKGEYEFRLLNGHLAGKIVYDGVWDCWKFNDFCDLCSEYLDAQDTVDVVVNKLLDERMRRAKQHFGKKHFDDASLVLMVCRGQ